MSCEVCNDEPVAGVACVPGVPMSVAYGRKCLDANAHPMWVLAANTAMVGGYDEAADWWKAMVDDTLKHLGITRAEFDRLVAEETEQLDAGMAELDDPASVTEHDRVIGQEWFVVLNDHVGGWSVANVDKPLSQIVMSVGAERCVADFWSKEVAEYVVNLHNSSLRSEPS
jgi:hypothetical protein